MQQTVFVDNHLYEQINMRGTVILVSSDIISKYEKKNKIRRRGNLFIYTLTVGYIWHLEISGRMNS